MSDYKIKVDIIDLKFIIFIIFIMPVNMQLSNKIKPDKIK